MNKIEREMKAGGLIKDRAQKKHPVIQKEGNRKHQSNFTKKMPYRDSNRSEFKQFPKFKRKSYFVFVCKKQRLSISMESTCIYQEYE